MKQLHGGLLLMILGLAGCETVFSDPEPTSRIVFTTSQKYRGDQLGGVDGADAICADHAAEAGLSGSFKAWLSQLDNAVTDRFTHSTVPYVLVDGTKLAASWTGLISFDILTAINLDEHGAGLPFDDQFDGVQPVWSATRIDGQALGWTPGGDPSSNPRPDCTAWSSLEGGVGQIGSWNDTGMVWTWKLTSIACSESARLFCFQQ